jgi:hypothetical protein
MSTDKFKLVMRTKRGAALPATPEERVQRAKTEAYDSHEVLIAARRHRDRAFVAAADAGVPRDELPSGAGQVLRRLRHPPDAGRKRCSRQELISAALHALAPGPRAVRRRLPARCTGSCPCGLRPVSGPTGERITTSERSSTSHRSRTSTSTYTAITGRPLASRTDRHRPLRTRHDAEYPGAGDAEPRLT